MNIFALISNFTKPSESYKSKQATFGFSFPLCLQPCVPSQLNIMTISVQQEKLFMIWSLMPQRVHQTATARLAVSTTFHHGNLVSQFQPIYEAPD